MLGTGTQQDPYIIQDVTDLQNVNNDLTAYYELGNDIDASDTVNWNSGEGFQPIGDSTYFSGQLDGKGYKISNLTIKPTFIVDEMGGMLTFISFSSFFMHGLETTGVVKNLKLENIYCSDENADPSVLPPTVAYITVSSGTFVYQNQGIIDNCCATGSIDIIHNHPPNVTQDGTSTPSDVSGSFVLVNNGIITNCYADVNITGASKQFGFVGNNSNTVSNCYSLCTFNNYNTVSGFCDADTDSQGTTFHPTNCYWDTTVSGVITDGASGGTTGLTTSQMKTQSSYANWDFTNVWTIDEGNSYPELQIFAQNDTPQFETKTYTYPTNYTPLIDGFLIERNVNNTGWEIFNSTTTDNRIFQDTTVETGNNYQYRIKRITTWGEGDYTNIVAYDFTATTVNNYPTIYLAGVGTDTLSDTNVEVGYSRDNYYDSNYKVGYDDITYFPFPLTIGVGNNWVWGYNSDYQIGITNQSYLYQLDNYMGIYRELFNDTNSIIGVSRNTVINIDTFVGIDRYAVSVLDIIIGYQDIISFYVEFASAINEIRGSPTHFILGANIIDNYPTLFDIQAGTQKTYSYQSSYKIGLDNKTYFPFPLAIGVGNTWVWGYSASYNIGITNQTYICQLDNQYGISRTLAKDINSAIGIYRNIGYNTYTELGARINRNYPIIVDIQAGSSRVYSYQSNYIVGYIDTNDYNSDIYIGEIISKYYQNNDIVGVQRDSVAYSDYKIGYDNKTYFPFPLIIGVGGKWILTYPINYETGFINAVYYPIEVFMSAGNTVVFNSPTSFSIGGINNYFYDNVNEIGYEKKYLNDLSYIIGLNINRNYNFQNTVGYRDSHKIYSDLNIGLYNPSVSLFEGDVGVANIIYSLTNTTVGMANISYINPIRHEVGLSDYNIFIVNLNILKRDINEYVSIYQIGLDDLFYSYPIGVNTNLMELVNAVINLTVQIDNREELKGGVNPNQKLVGIVKKDENQLGQIDSIKLIGRVGKDIKLHR